MLRHGLCVAASLCFLVSCGDDDSSSAKPDYEVRSCDATSEGSVEVQDSVSYVCHDGVWLRQDGQGGVVGDSLHKDSIGKTIPVTHEDSVKVVDSSRVDSLSSVADTTKSSESGVEDSSGNSSEVAYALKDVKIMGLFGYGILESKNVSVSELDSALNTTGLSFLPTVDSRKGSYSVANVTSEKPYVKVGVHGKIADVVHGVTLSMKDTLSVIVGGSGKNLEANINVLTFLKSKYMEGQLKKKGSKTFAEASKKASDAVWDMFHFDKSELVSVDSVTSIAGIDPSNAALLAVTIMMQAVINDSVANLWKVAADVADGSWDDSLARAKIADWAFNEDVNDNFETILKNVERLKLGITPPFEQYIRAFYRAELGIPACTEENGGEVVFSKNPYSVFYAADMSDVSVTTERFFCNEKTKAWREAMDKEKDTYGFGVGTNGEIRQGLVNAGLLYSYNASSDNWRVDSSEVTVNAFFVDKSNITDFVDIKTVYEGIKADEKVIFLLRHGQRDQNATSKEDGLSKAGLDSSKAVGAKLMKFDEPMRLGASEFYRAQQTVIGIALGRDSVFAKCLDSVFAVGGDTAIAVCRDSAIARSRGQDTLVVDTIPELNDDWYMIDRQLVNQAESDAGGGWEATSLYTYTGAYSGENARINAYYNLEERSAELIELLYNKYKNQSDRFIMLSSHDKLMVPFVAYCSKLRINMNIKNGGTWINYFAGIAIIWDKSGNRRYVAFKGLKDAYFQGW
ncbi:hypothetical protein [uncultured Fibrobacter sp.]|uniref:hypothetical protein n=1 Tax=uncultured Fibrobacter sp. TaxID=261512 RepID=UPI0025D5E08C|nr:hypothetical protein [uncultured Fibrobacter sp.]